MSENRFFDVVPAMIIFSIVALVGITMWITYFGVFNDYVFYPLQNVIINSSNMLPANVPALTQSFGNSFLSVGNYIDPMWLLCYIMFLGTTIYYCYRARPESYFSVLGILFYGVMVILFMLSIVVQILVWFNDNFTQKIIGNLSTQIPMFTFWFNHIGIFFLIHILICILVLTMDFDLANFFHKKDKEDKLDGEVL